MGTPVRHMSCNNNASDSIDQKLSSEAEKHCGGHCFILTKNNAKFKKHSQS